MTLIPSTGDFAKGFQCFAKHTQGDTPKIVLNRVFSTPADGFFHVMPFGEYDGKLLDGTPIIQVFDQEAARNLQAAIAGAKAKAGANWTGVLVDLEHRSLLPDGDTTAAAWVPELQERADGVYGAFNMTDLGEPLVKGGRYRTLSPVFNMTKIGTAPDGRARMRPTSMDSIGLTNRPNLKGMKPLSDLGLAVNAEHWFENDVGAAPGAVPGDEPVATADKAKNKKDARMKEIMKALGLAEDATPEAALQAVNSLVEQSKELTTVKNRLSEIEAQALGREADEFVAANKDRIQDPVKVKDLYVANQEFAKSFVAALKPADKPAATALNRETARTPGDKKISANKLEQFRSMPEGNEKDQYQTANAAELIALEREEQKAK